MPKIKDKPKKQAKVAVTTQIPLGHISFSFKYLTRNKAHNFEYFKKDLRKSQLAYEALFERMTELCGTDMIAAKLAGKISGCEPIPYSRLSETMRGICDSVEIISRDSSLSVFRFNKNNYRLLCKTDLNHSNLLHIIGFDFDYSAYDHGA